MRNMDDTTLNKQIGTNIQKHRKIAKLSTTELGEIAGVSQSTISQIENGRATYIATVVRICKALNISLADVLPLNSVLDQASFVNLNDTRDLENITSLIELIDELTNKERKIVKDLLYSIINNR